MGNKSESWSEAHDCCPCQSRSLSYPWDWASHTCDVFHAFSKIPQLCLHTACSCERSFLDNWHKGTQFEGLWSMAIFQCFAKECLILYLDCSCTWTQQFAALGSWYCMVVRNKIESILVNLQNMHAFTSRIQHVELWLDKQGYPHARHMPCIQTSTTPQSIVLHSCAKFISTSHQIWSVQHCRSKVRVAYNCNTSAYRSTDVQCNLMTLQEPIEPNLPDLQNSWELLHPIRISTDHFIVSGTHLTN